MSEFWDEQVIMGEVSRGERNKIVVSTTRKGDKRYIDIRTFYTERNSDIWIPGKGISIPLEQFGQVFEILNGIER